MRPVPPRPDNLGDLPEAERPKYDRERYRVTVQGGRLFWRGAPLDTKGGEEDRFIFVMSPEGDIYAADHKTENVKEGAGAWLAKLDEAAEWLLKRDFTVRYDAREAPTYPADFPTEPVACAMQAIDRLPGCKGQLTREADGKFVVGVRTRQLSPTGFVPDGEQEKGVELFVDRKGYGAWVCDECLRHRSEKEVDGRKSTAPRWPVIHKPTIDLAAIRKEIVSYKLQNDYHCALDALDYLRGGLRKRVAPALRAAATERLVKSRSPKDPTQRITLLHHSSFLAGGPVAAAGMLGATDGRLTYLSNNSGHYSPPRPLMLQMLSRLHALGADLSRTSVYFLNDKTWDLSTSWREMRAEIGDVGDPEAMKRGYAGPAPDLRARLRQELRAAIDALRRPANLVARSPDAPPAPCAEPGCGGTATCVVGDEVGETWLCQRCLDRRLLGPCDAPGCDQPSVHVVGGDRRDRKVGVHLCAAHFRERLVLRCAETGCARTSESSVMDVIGASFFCKEHFAEGQRGLGVDVCDDPRCTETEDVALVDQRRLCKAHRR